MPISAMRATPFPGVAPATHPASPPPPPTDEQVEILDAYATGRGLVVEALAGTGKTTTLRQIAQASGPTRRGLYLAFNRAIVNEAQGRFPSSVFVTTAHSLAYRAVGKNYAQRLQTPRMYAAQIAARLKVKAVELDGHTLSPSQRVRIADQTVRKFTSSADQVPGAQHVPDRALHLGTREAVWEAVRPVVETWWADLSRVSGTLPFTHDVYLKLWQLQRPQLAFDYVMFDEAQDADPVIASIVASQPTQTIYVGDRHQQLYAWRGAVDAMAAAPGHRLALTHSFRFGEQIAEQANGWLTKLGARLRVTGRGAPGTIGPILDTPDAVLCRTNGTALGHVIEFQERGVPVALAPGDRNAGSDIKTFAWAARDLMNGRGTDHPELSNFKDWAELLQYVEEEGDDGAADIKRLVGIINRLGYPAVIDAVNRCVLAADAAVMVSTAHKSKGLEWDRVKVADDFAPPEAGDAPEPADLMLAYVTVTRAKRELDRGSLDLRVW